MMNEPFSVFRFPLSDLSPFIIHHSTFIIFLWLFALGGAVGSFLNVVVYRLPSGISLVHPGSHCPACKKPIRWYDNVPIFGWFFLRGRCRDCKGKIAFRYPLVEAITATTFALVGLADGVVMVPGDLGFEFVRPNGGDFTYACFLIACHLVLLCTLLAAGLIEYDGHRLPVRLVVPALVVGLLAPLVWPGLERLVGRYDWPLRLTILAENAAGAVVGALLGCCAWYAVVPHCRLGLVLGLACVGLFLGEVGIVVVILAILLAVPAVGLSDKRPGLHRLSPNLFLAAATLVLIFSWGNLESNLLRVFHGAVP
jgi:leader peptidase (prepilin peptidase)/N-methyltransferase